MPPEFRSLDTMGPTRNLLREVLNRFVQSRNEMISLAVLSEKKG